MENKQVVCRWSERRKIVQYMEGLNIKKLLLVCGSNVCKMDIYNDIRDLLTRLNIEVIPFSDFLPNPDYGSVVAGVDEFCRNGCDGIMAVGGGSAMDVAKCIKLFARMNRDTDFLNQERRDNGIPLLAFPTTAGSGSEATRFAVIYREGKKLSITDEKCIPSLVMINSDILNFLPLYQKKATALDALCHGIESYWSVNSTDESKSYAAEAIRLVLANFEKYLSGSSGVNDEMMRGAYMAGRAINITQTTAGHAMAYKLTGIYGFAHGHAAALCVDRLWIYMAEHINEKELCADERGQGYLQDTLAELACIMGGNKAAEGAKIFHRLLESLELEKCEYSEENIDILTGSVNAERLKNHPVRLSEAVIRQLYTQMMRD